jgi:hypothetical protein
LVNRPQDVVVLREKYRTVNRYIQFGDRTAQWVGNQTVLAVEMQPRPHAPELARKIREIVERVNRQAPSWELIDSDLQAERDSLGSSYREACTAYARLWCEAWKEVEAVLADFDHARMVTALVLAMHATVEYLVLGLLPSTRLRDALTLQLRSVWEGVGKEGTSTDSDPLTAPAELPVQDEPPPVEPAYCFRMGGELWYVRYGEEYGTFKNHRGMQHIARLLASPGKRVSVFDLAGQGQQGKGSRPSLAGGQEPGEAEEDPRGKSRPEPVLDQQAKQSYKRRMEELVQEIKEAKEAQDQETEAKARKEFDELAEQLQKAVGLGGRDRPLDAGDPAEKARVAISKALNRAYQALEQATPPLPGLVAHLRQTISAAGGFCIYRPDPARTPGWTF